VLSLVAGAETCVVWRLCSPAWRDPPYDLDSPIGCGCHSIICLPNLWKIHNVSLRCQRGDQHVLCPRILPQSCPPLVKIVWGAICVSTVLAYGDIDSILGVPTVWLVIDWPKCQPVVSRKFIVLFQGRHGLYGPMVLSHTHPQFPVG
jgi:hypothetical protein